MDMLGRKSVLRSVLLQACVSVLAVLVVIGRIATDSMYVMHVSNHCITSRHHCFIHPYRRISFVYYEVKVNDRLTSETKRCFPITLCVISKPP